MLKVTNILNLVPGSTNLFKNSFKYHNIEAWPPNLEELNTLINSVIKEQQTGIIVYCMTGE
jgi:hypothetical protein